MVGPGVGPARPETDFRERPRRAPRNRAGAYRTHALPPRYPPGVFVLIAHGGQNICFNKPRLGPFYLIF